MKIAVLGATGMAGSRIVAEALRRGHEVTGIARNPEKLPPQDRLTLRKGDALAAGLSDLLRGHDVLVSAVHFSIVPPEAVLEPARAAGVKRLVVVGGAGSLEVAPGVQLVDTPEFHEEWKPEALGGRAFLETLKKQAADLDWTFLSPSALFMPGERTGRFRRGTDQLLTDGAGKSHISAEDYAIALLDEIENPEHIRQRFTVGY
ncbi:NAD(P)-dependent oxidoreductase [Microvirga rosea]|uniref:NAD(P)-dependent oxidoreductase n=1 Tax=Microvirga rosea TaxID=2715425 RepID=UPI001D09A3D7|nr:NAD(P)-dependent oxidoreductase [Microvirga rosea]MCB8822609.1 NAD(P)-dependent oxidoreductase [Microvirga rosea]